MTDVANSFVEALRHVLGNGPVGLHEPVFRGRERQFLLECIDSTFVSSVGEFVERLESGLTAATGARYCVAVVNGTEALHVALLLAGVAPGDEVLVPTLSFVATANAVSYCGAIPHFVDSNVGTLGMDAGALRERLESTSWIIDGQCVNRLTGRPIRAMVPMHTFGHPCAIEDLVHVADEYGIVVVEDAAEGLGSRVNGRHVGTFGLAGVLSFNGNKTITTGGGGAILTDDPAVAKRAKHLTTTARVPHAWSFDHDEVGFNFRMPNINAALGCAQLEQLQVFLASKRRLYERYEEAFASVAGITLVREPTGCQSNYWLQTVRLDESIQDSRDEILQLANEMGYGVRPAWKLLHTLVPYRHCPSAPLPVAQSLESTVVNIPSSAGLA